MPAIEYTSPRTGRVYEWRPEDDSTPTSEDMNWFVGVVDEQEASTGQSAESSAANAAVRGAMSLGPSAVQGAGALIPGEMGDDLRAVGKDMQEGVESTYPVNPKYEDTWVAKAPGAIGQGATFLGAAMAAPASAILGAAGLAGAASGADMADELGLEGVRRGVTTLGYGLAEAASERAFGIGSPRFLKGAGRPAVEAAKAIGGEAAEEPLAGALQDAVRDVAVIGTDIPMVNPLNPAKRFEEAAYGAVGALAFGGAAGLQAQRLQGAKLVAQVEGEYVELPTDITEEGVAAMGLRPDQVRVVRPDPALQQAVANAPTEGVRQTLQEVMLATSPQEDVFNAPGDALSELDALVPEETVDDTVDEEEPLPPETANPAPVEQAPGGVSDPDTSVIGPATGSSAPAVSIPNTESTPTEVNEENPFLERMDSLSSELRQLEKEKPRPLNKTFGSLGRTTQNAEAFDAHKQNISKWNSRRAKVVKEYRALVEKSNDWHYSQKKNEPPTTVEDLATSDVKATRNVDPAAFRQKMRSEAPAPQPVNEQPADILSQFSRGDKVTIHYADGRTKSGTFESGGGMKFFQPDDNSENVPLGAGGMEMEGVVNVTLDTEKKDVEEDRGGSLLGEYGMAQPVTRDEYEQTLWGLAKLISEHKAEFDDPDYREKGRRRIQLEKQFDATADEIGLSRAKRRYVRSNWRSFFKGGPMPRPIDYMEGPMEAAAQEPPKPNDFDPDPTVRRKRSERPIEALPKLAEVQGSLRAAQAELSRGRLRPERRAQLERIVKERENQLRLRQYVEARIEDIQKKAGDPNIEPSPQSISTEGPSNTLSPADIRMRVAGRHRMATGQVDVVNRPDLPANGWINKSTGKVVLNAPYLQNAHHIDETLYHEYVHRIEYDPDFQRDLKDAMSAFSKQDLEELDAAIARARYDINEIPTERQAVALSRAAIAFRNKPAFRRLVQRVKTWFKQQFGRPLDQRDAEAIASRIIAKSMAQARGGAPVVTRAGSANVRRSADDARDAEYLAAVESGDMETAQRLVDEAANLIPHKHHQKDNVLTAFPKVAEAFLSEFYRETGKGFFSTGLYDQTELKYLVREEGRTIDAGTRLRKESVDWLLSNTTLNLDDLSEGSDLDFWGQRWGMKAAELKNLIESAAPVTRDEQGNVIPLSERFKDTSDDIRYSRPLEGEEGPTAQVFGREGTAPVTPASFDTATPIIKEKFFDSDQPVSPEQTARVLDLAYRYMGEGTGPVLAAEVRAAVPSTDQHIANGILRAEMDAYGLKMLAAGDPTVYDLMQRYATTDFVIGLDEEGKPITYRRVAQELAGNSRHPTTAAATARDHVNVAKRKANAKVLGDEAFDAISRTVDTTKLSEAEVAAVGDTVLPSGETLRQKVDKATPKRTKKQRAKENPEVKAAQAKLDDATKAAKSERAKGESLLDQLAKSQSDTPSLRDSRVDEVRKVYYEALKKNYSDEALRAWLEGRLTPLEVPPNILTPLIETIVRERAIRVAIKTSEADIIRRTEKLATGETGSLAGLERALSGAPAALQRSPAWRRRLILDYFMQGGLDKRSAGIAARAYEKEFAERLVQATENAVKKLLKSKAPWSKKIAAAKGIRERALSKEQEKLFKAVRLGLTDPTKLWDEEMAKQNEWNGFTHKQHIRLQEIDAILKDPHLVPNQRASLIHEINGYITDAQQPPNIGRTILASYVASALGGFSTVGVQFSAHVGGVVGALTYMAGNPLSSINVSKMLAQSGRTAVDETAFAFTTGTYRTEILETLKGYEKPLEFLLKKGRENFKSDNPATKIKGVGQMLVGAQEYTMKALNSIDQGFITSAKEMTAMLGTHDLLKRLGLRKEHLNQIIEEAMRAKADLYHSLVDSGVPRSLANADATDIFMKNLYETVARRSETLDGFSMEDWADDILRAAELEAEGRTGRISKGNPAHGEGMLQSAFAWPLKGISEGMGGENGALALYLRSIYGFMAIPFRTAMWYAGYSPYGFVRYGLHHAFEAAGKDSPYRQSYGTRTQVRQRLREATAGTIVTAMLAALASSTADDDEENENALFVTGGGPGYNDMAFREAWLRRFKPYSIVLKINGRYHAFNYGRLGESLGWAATLAGSLDDVAISKKNKESRGGELDMIDSMAGNLMGNLAERSAFKGLFNVGTMIMKSKEPGNTERAASQLAFASSAIVPWKSAMNTFQRMVADPVDNDTVRGSIISAIPVVGPLAGRPRLNVLGDPAGDMSKGGRAFALGLVSFGSPEGGKAYDLIMQHGRGPSAYQRNDFSKRYETDDTDTKFYEFSRLRGQKIKSALETNYARLVSLDSEGFAEFLKRLSRQVNESTANEMKLKQTTVE